MSGLMHYLQTAAHSPSLLDRILDRIRKASRPLAFPA